jgi:hypothetical protein
MGRAMTEQERRVCGLVRRAFAGVTLGAGVGLRQGQGLDDYADAHTLASLRERDEKRDWSAIPVTDLDNCYSSLSFFDAEGMRFHLPAYLIADLEGALHSADPMFHLVHLVDGMEFRFELLSAAQREAVREYLLLRLSDPNHEFVHPMIRAALGSYWTAPSKS